jgi:hypothetical protein
MTSSPAAASQIRPFAPSGCVTVWLSGLLALLAGTPALAAAGAPGCAGLSAAACLDLSIAAVGGRQALERVSSAQLDVVQSTLLTEQSYRQAPFITAYDRIDEVVDFAHGRVRVKDHGLWPEADPNLAAAESDATTVSTAKASVVKMNAADAAGSLAGADDARVALELGPERLLLTASAAPDLHLAPAESLRATVHDVVAFTWSGHPVKLLLNRFNHLPDAVEMTRTFKDFWFVWGDVDQRIYFDNWKVIGGVTYPTNQVDERNGLAWSTSQVLDAKFNGAIDETALAMDPAATAKSAQSKGWSRGFEGHDPTVLAPGVDLYKGAWNVTLIRQGQGVLLLEAPISPTYTESVLDRARELYPKAPVTGVLSTSDSWPHVAGVREAVAEGLPVYILDLNRPLLDRMMAAPHRQAPDRLQQHPRAPLWIVVSDRLEVGSGPNRMVLFPLRGAATERQYMVYFPEHRLLYASDTVVVDADKHRVYDPELTLEVVAAVKREHLAVDTLYGMHQAPIAWAELQRDLADTLHPAASAG